MSEVQTACIPSPLGNIVIRAKADHIIAVSFDVDEYEPTGESVEVIEACKKQLQEYFDGTRTTFSLPLSPEGTGFQKEVWEAVRDIKFGDTASYKDIALKLGKPDAVRAVGSANGQNKLLLLIPCHRIVGQDRSLVGYAGQLWRKQWLLEHEAKFSGKPQQLQLF
ncbi:MAG TPA: methylated-DNA--[protein]-cysteine S-methyltransferase [Cytophagaceae bacterium]